METVANQLRLISARMEKEAGIMENIRQTWDAWMRKKDIPLVEKIKQFIEKGKMKFKDWFLGDPQERATVLKAIPEVTEKRLKPIYKEDKLTIVPDTTHREIQSIPREEIKDLRFAIV